MRKEADPRSLAIDEHDNDDIDPLLDADFDENAPQYHPPSWKDHPPIAIDYAAVERAASIHCTIEEIATIVGVSRRTVQNRLKDDPEMRAAMERGTGRGKAQLRRLQWRGARDGNPTLLIWLGKQWLGQKDKSELTGADDGPLKVIVELVGDDAPARQENRNAAITFDSDVELIG